MREKSQKIRENETGNNYAKIEEPMLFNKSHRPRRGRNTSGGAKRLDGKKKRGKTTEAPQVLGASQTETRGEKALKKTASNRSKRPERKKGVKTGAEEGRKHTVRLFDRTPSINRGEGGGIDKKKQSNKHAGKSQVKKGKKPKDPERECPGRDREREGRRIGVSQTKGRGRGDRSIMKLRGGSGRREAKAKKEAKDAELLNNWQPPILDGG